MHFKFLCTHDVLMWLFVHILAPTLCFQLSRFASHVGFVWLSLQAIITPGRRCLWCQGWASSISATSTVEKHQQPWQRAPASLPPADVMSVEGHDSEVHATETKQVS